MKLFGRPVPTEPSGVGSPARTNLKRGVRMVAGICALALPIGGAVLLIGDAWKPAVAPSGETGRMLRGALAAHAAGQQVQPVTEPPAPATSAPPSPTVSQKSSDSHRVRRPKAAAVQARLSAPPQPVSVPPPPPAPIPPPPAPPAPSGPTFTFNCQMVRSNLDNDAGGPAGVCDLRSLNGFVGRVTFSVLTALPPDTITFVAPYLDFHRDGETGASMLHVNATLLEPGIYTVDLQASGAGVTKISQVIFTVSD